MDSCVEGAQPALRTFAACGPLGPCCSSNSTFSPSARLRKPSDWMAVWWTKTSFPPPSGVMNPKPFASLNHFTVPVAIRANFFRVQAASRREPAVEQSGPCSTGERRRQPFGRPFVVSRPDPGFPVPQALTGTGVCLPDSSMRRPRVLACVLMVPASPGALLLAVAAVGFWKPQVVFWPIGVVLAALGLQLVARGLQAQLTHRRRARR